MKENAIKKINKMGKVGHIITKIAKIIIIIGIAATFIAGIACMVLPKNLLNIKLNGQANVSADVSDIKTLSRDAQEDLIEDFEEECDNKKLHLNGNSYSLASYRVDENGFELYCNASLATINMRSIGEICFAICLYLVITLISLIFFGKICKSLKSCESPFDAAVIKNLQNFSFSLIPWVAVSSIKNVIFQIIFSSSFSIGFSFNLGMVLIVLIILALSYIFKYGAMLQQEADETL